MTQQNGKTFYEVLGVETRATYQEINRAYRRLSKKHHPDTTEVYNEDMWLQISEAYATLSTPGLREAYDGLLALGDQVTTSASTQPKKKTFHLSMRKLQQLFTDCISIVVAYGSELIYLIRAYAVIFAIITVVLFAVLALVLLN